MPRIGLRELRSRLSDIVRDVVHNGSAYVVCSHSRELARIVPTVEDRHLDVPATVVEIQLEPEDDECLPVLTLGLKLDDGRTLAYTVENPGFGNDGQFLGPDEALCAQALCPGLVLEDVRERGLRAYLGLRLLTRVQPPIVVSAKPIEAPPASG